MRLDIQQIVAFYESLKDDKFIGQLKEFAKKEEELRNLQATVHADVEKQKEILAQEMKKLEDTKTTMYKEIDEFKKAEMAKIQLAAEENARAMRILSTEVRTEKEQVIEMRRALDNERQILANEKSRFAQQTEALKAQEAAIKEKSDRISKIVAGMAGV